MNEIRKLSENEKRNISMNVFRAGSEYMLAPPEIRNALVNPKASDYDYFISFESNAPTFTEGIKGLLDAAKTCAYEGFMWAVREIILQQKNFDLDATQAWYISGFPGSSGTRLRGFHANAEETFVILDPENTVVEKITYEESIPEGVTVALWMDYSTGHSLLMLPSEYKKSERYGAAA